MARKKKTATEAIITARTFNTITEMERHLSAGVTQTAVGFSAHSEGKSDSDKRFTGTESYEQANNLLLYGDRDLARRITEAGTYTTEAKIQKYMAKRMYTAAVVGAVPHVANYVAGCPNTMIRIQQTRQPQKVVTIGYCMTVSAFVETEDMVRVASEMVSAIMILEAKGIRVNYYTLNYNYANEGETRHIISNAVKIKSAGQKLDLLKMAYPMASPSMFRRHIFKFFETEPGIPKAFVWGYGCVCNDTPTVKKHMADVHKIKFDAVFSYDDINGKSAEQIVDMVCAGDK